MVVLMPTRYVNLTTHDVRVYTGHCRDPYSDRNLENWIMLPYTGLVARVDSISEITSVGGVQTLRMHMGATVGIPDAQPGVVYVTSSLSARTAMRIDVVSPDIDRSPVLDSQDRIYAVRGWKQWIEKEGE